MALNHLNSLAYKKLKAIQDWSTIGTFLPCTLQIQIIVLGINEKPKEVYLTAMSASCRLWYTHMKECRNIILPHTYCIYTRKHAVMT